MRENPIRIDVRKALESKMPRYAKYIPRFVTHWLANLICQDGLNRLLADNHGKVGVDFADAVLNDLNVKVHLTDDSILNNINEPVIFVSNHPLGGLDGIALISLLGKHFDGRFKVIVNDLLMQVKPLADVFLPINKHGSQSRKVAHDIDEAFLNGTQMLVFPAGLCSRKMNDGSIADLKWQKSFIRQSLDYHRNVVPIFFEAQNSHFFYIFAKLRAFFGIKFNIEMLLLPREVFKNSNKTFIVRMGEPIPWQRFSGGDNLSDLADSVRNTVYELKQ